MEEFEPIIIGFLLPLLRVHRGGPGRFSMRLQLSTRM